MQCRHCGFGNGGDDHRCLRCGRRLQGVVTAAPPGYAGANALALAPQTLDETLENAAEFAGAPEQAHLFAATPPNVIPFDQLRRHNTGRITPAPPQPQQGRAPVRNLPARTASRRTPAPPGEQATLDFILPGPAAGRKLKTEVDAQIFCDQPVATPTHRAVAAVIDAALILLGFGVLTLTFEALGGRFGDGRLLWAELGLIFTLVALFYGSVWAIAGCETAGMRATDLHLITFDGFPLDGRTRTLRFLATWLSFCSAGLGVLWALADEENLAWHDHISRTFPAIRETPRTFVKQRR